MSVAGGTGRSLFRRGVGDHDAQHARVLHEADVDPAAFLNLRAGFRADKGWEFSGWVRNVTNTETFDWLATQSGNTGLVIGQPADPRTWGITVATRF